MAASDREKIAKRRQRRRRRRLKTSVKIFLVLFFCIAGVGAYAGYIYYQNKNAPDPYGKLKDIQGENKKNNYDLTEDAAPIAKYWVLDVGKGESIFVKSDQTNILIDTGAAEDGKAVISGVKGEITGGLDYLIITSPSERRIGGIKAVCETLKPKKVILCPMEEDVKANIIKSIGNIPVEDGKNMTITLAENSNFYVFLPDVSSKDPYDRSLMTLLRHGNTAFFAESDAGEEEEARVIPEVGKVDVLVLSRSGSEKVNQLVGETNASTYIVSDAKGGGPDQSVIEGLRGSLFATYNSGTIKFATDGGNIESNLDQEKRIKEKTDEALSEESDTEDS